MSNQSIAYKVSYKKLTGSTEGAILLAQIIYWQSKMKGEFYKTDKEWRDELSFSRYEFEQAKIKIRPFISCRLGGMPRKTYYSVDLNKLEASLHTYCSQENSIPVSKLTGRHVSSDTDIQEAIIYSRIPVDYNSIEKNIQKEILETQDQDQELEIENPQETKIIQPTKKPATGSRFDEFWNLYPRKVGKKKAEIAYKIATKQISEDFLIEALRDRLPDILAKEEGYRPHPATWLNGGRWDDELSAYAPLTAQQKQAAIADSNQIIQAMNAKKELQIEELTKLSFPYAFNFSSILTGKV